MIISKKTGSVLLLSVSLFMTSCDTSEESGKDEQSAPLHKVEVTIIERQPVKHRQIVSGTLEAITSVRLYSDEGGRITKLPYYEGDRVEKDAVVITLDDDLIQAELDKAIAQRQQAALDLKRLKKLLPKKLTSEEEVARASTALNVAKAEEQLQQTRLARSRVKAPFSGVISQRNNEPGDTVSAHSHILSMIDPTTMRVKVQISERWIPLMQQGDKVEVRIDAIGDILHKGFISRIHPVIDPATRKGTLEVMLDKVPENARAGQLARVHISSQAMERLVVPSLAVHHDMDGAFAYIAEQDIEGIYKAIKHKILKGAQFGNLVEVIDGVNVNDKVVIKGFLGLRDKKRIQIENTRRILQDNLAPEDEQLADTPSQEISNDNKPGNDTPLTVPQDTPDTSTNVTEPTVQQEQPLEKMEAQPGPK